MSSSQREESRAEELGEMAKQLEELREAIRITQDRYNLVASELQELRLALNTISSVSKYKQQAVMVSLDRRGFAYVKASITDVDNIIVHIGQDLYAKLPIDKAQEILKAKERDYTTLLREIEAELRKLTELYAALDRKLREQLSKYVQQQQQQQQRQTQ